MLNPSKRPKIMLEWEW